MTATFERREDWLARLIAYLDEVRVTPFAYGRQDCALFAAGAVQAMTGNDPAAAWRGKYKTRAHGERLVTGNGGPIGVAAALFAEVPPAMAQVGDLSVVPSEEGDALGVVQGETIFVLRADGIGMVPLLTAVRAFRV